jgi:hypothetical protein
VGYDTAVIGGTMALTSFIRDFGMADIAKSSRDTIQGNIVSTFQVSLLESLYSWHGILMKNRRDASSERSSLFLSPNALGGKRP